MFEKLDLTRRTIDILNSNNLNRVDDFLDLRLVDVMNSESLMDLPLNDILKEIKKEYSLEKKETDINQAISEDVGDSSIAKCIGEKLLVMHHVDEKTMHSDFKSILFKIDEELIAQDILLEKINFSNRTSGVLSRNNYSSLKQIAYLKYDELVAMKNMGAKSVQEIIDYLQKHMLVISECDEEFIAIESYVDVARSQLEFKLKNEQSNMLLGAIISWLYHNYKSINNFNPIKFLEKDEVAIEIYTNHIVFKEIKEYVMSLVRREVNVNRDIKECFPNVMLLTNIVDIALEKLIQEKRLEKLEEKYYIYRVNVFEALRELKSQNAARVLLLRMEGKTLEEAGNELGVTRERARQLEVKALEQLPDVKEDRFEYWYCNYNLSEDDFTKIFNVDSRVFEYLGIKFGKQLKNGAVIRKTIDDLLEDENLKSEQINNLMDVYGKYKTVINGEYIPIKRDLILKAYIKWKYSDKDVELETLYEEYNQLLMELGLSDRENLKFTGVHALDARLDDSDYVLCKYGNKIRYYEIKQYDQKAFFEKLGLEYFNNKEISTFLFFKNVPDLLNEYDLRDEYEVHNYFRKNKDLLSEYNISLGRSPFISIGEVNRETQVEKLLFKIAPVGLYEYCEAYESEYGVRSDTVLANFLEPINKYYHNKEFTVNQKIMYPVEMDTMRRLMLDDFYFIEDIEKIFLEQFPSSDITKVNAYNLKQIGFKVFTNYIVRDTYNTADDYFRKLITNNDIFDMGSLDKRMIYLQGLEMAVHRMRSQYEILEMEPSVYITKEAFFRMHPDISVEDLIEYGDDARAYATECYYTIRSLRRKGFTHKLDSINMSEYFYGGLLRIKERGVARRVGGNYIISNEEKKFVLIDFIKMVISSVGNMPVDELIQYVDEQYGIVLDKYRLTALLADSGVRLNC